MRRRNGPGVESERSGECAGSARPHEAERIEAAGFRERPRARQRRSGSRRRPAASLERSATSTRWSSSSTRAIEDACSPAKDSFRRRERSPCAVLSRRRIDHPRSRAPSMRRRIADRGIRPGTGDAAVLQVIANGSTVYAVGQEETYAITGRATRRLAPPTFAEHCGLTIAHLEGVTFIRDPWMAKQYPRDVIGLSRFPVPAL